MNPTVPDAGVKVPPVPDTTGLAVKLIVLVPPLRVPFVRIHVLVKVWVNKAPRFRVPPVPLIVKPAPPAFPVNVATPAVFVMDTRPVVVNVPIFWAIVVPVIIINELPAVSVPALVKSPWKVSELFAVARVADALIFKGTLVLFPNCLAVVSETIPVPLIITPPVPANVAGHSISEATDLAEDPALY